MPEFLVIAIVALVVLGPERLPEVMRRAGTFYRQARELMQQYTGEAQRMFDEGMREVEDVSATINSAWQSATTDGADANLPPPALRQLPPPLLPPATAADAGPWTLPAWQRESAAEREPRPLASAVSPFALERQAPPEATLDGYTGTGYGGTALLAAAPPEADMPDLDPLASGAQAPDLPPIPSLPPSGGPPPEVAPPPAPGARSRPAARPGPRPGGRQRRHLRRPGPRQRRTGRRAARRPGRRRPPAHRDRALPQGRPHLARRRPSTST